jgi:tripartite-type tricarboxylate transporter receptor subunit TctC
MRLRAALFGLAALLPAVLPLSPVRAQSATEFYRGKTLDLYIGYSVGGGYDLYARLLARHMGRHIPGNPTIVPRNMEGAASLRLANWLAKVAPKDGSVFGTIGRGVAFDPLLGQKDAQFQGPDFTWIGSANNEVSICASWHTSTVVRFEDLQIQELIVAATGASDDTMHFARILNGVLRTKLKPIAGYPGGNDMSLAMERGEVQGRCSWSWSSVRASNQAWLDQKKINILAQLALTKHPDLPDVPLAIDLARSDEDRQVLKLVFARQVAGRPFLAPPGVPKDRADMLRKAFMDTMRDPDFLAEAAKARLEITPVSGDELDALVRDLYATPAAISQRAAAILKQ